MRTYPIVRASRILPVRAPLSGQRCDLLCWRCGIAFFDHKSALTLGAPCRDCRDSLRHDGADTGRFFRTGIDPKMRKKTT